MTLRLSRTLLGTSSLERECGDFRMPLRRATVPAEAVPEHSHETAHVILAIDENYISGAAGASSWRGPSLEVRGSNEFGRSFVGIAFRGANRDTYDVVYVRPFRFRSDDPALAAHGLQYMSVPDHPWPVLRERSLGVYESSIDSAPDPNDWVHLTVRFRARRMQAFVNGARSPQLDLPLLTQRTGGRAALWVGNDSSGAFRNLRDCS
jgi:hypothetical protein